MIKKNIKGYPHRWGYGTTHVEKAFPFALCGHHVHGQIVDPREHPVTCRKCMKIMGWERPDHSYCVWQGKTPPSDPSEGDLWISFGVMKIHANGVWQRVRYP